MIEKLDLPSSARLVCGKDYDLAFKYIKQTVNQLVDAVNGILDYAPLEMAMKAEPKPADAYAEQRKWIGKACWFWDDEKEEKVCGILTTIDSDCGLSDMCPYWNGTTSNWFEHCEPVKPDDDIIYKGGDNDDR